MPLDQQARLRTFVQSKIPKGKVSEVARKAGMSPSTLHGFLDGNDALGELSAIKLSKVLGVEIEQLFYNSGHDPAKANPEAGTPTQEEDRAREDRARKDRAIREIERLIAALDDPAERARAWDVVLGTVRAYTDAHTSPSAAQTGAEDSDGFTGRGGRGRPAGRGKARAGKDVRG